VDHRRGEPHVVGHRSVRRRSRRLGIHILLCDSSWLDAAAGTRLLDQVADDPRLLAVALPGALTCGAWTVGPGGRTLALASIAALGPDFVPYDRAVIHRTGQRGRWSASRDSCRRGGNCRRLLRLETNRPASPSCGDHAPKRALEPVLSSAIGTSAARPQQIDLALGASYAGVLICSDAALLGPRSSTTATPGAHVRIYVRSLLACQRINDVVTAIFGL
jgi:hypothetical protein